MTNPVLGVKSNLVAQQWLITTVLLGVGLAAVASVSGCQKAAATATAPKPPEVVVQTPIREDVLEYEETTGRLVAQKAVDIRSRVSGYLDKAFFLPTGRSLSKASHSFKSISDSTTLNWRRPRRLSIRQKLDLNA